MKFLTDIISKDKNFKELYSEIEEKRLPLCSFGLSDIHKSALIAGICEKSGKKAAVLTATESEATQVTDDLNSFGINAIMLNFRDYDLTRSISGSREYEQMRTDTLSKVSDGGFDALVFSCDSAVCYTVSPEILKNSKLSVKFEDTIDLEDFCEKVTLSGYQRAELCESAGQFSVRGGILDIFPVNLENPVRIDLFGDEIDQMSYFDPDTQRRTSDLKEFDIIPAFELLQSTEILAENIENFLIKNEGEISEKQKRYIRRDIETLRAGGYVNRDIYLPLLYDKKYSVFDYIKDIQLFCFESANISSRIKNLSKLHTEDISTLLESGSLCGKLSSLWIEEEEFLLNLKNAVFLNNFNQSVPVKALKSLIEFNCRVLSPFYDIKVLKDDLLSLNKGDTALIFAGEEKSAAVISEELKRSGKENILLKEYPKDVKSGIYCLKGSLSSGFEFNNIGLSIFTLRNAAPLKKKNKRPKNAKEIGSLDELKKGDLVVHSAHGIGIFDGISNITNAGITKDYIKIKYKGSDVLYVPVTQLDLVSKYIGSAQDGTVKLNRLGSDDWKKTRSRVKSAVRDMAKQLTALYAKRMAVKGYAFGPDTDLQNNFEQRFEYEETDDQLKCIDEIKKDMERPVPMDRLLLGDVGFGKTEVALRAAFKCISEGKQCAMLVPTTVLAMQHYETVKRRFSGLPVKAEVISRFTTPAKQRNILKGLKCGSVDMLIGTHRLISKDVEFKDLGLVIIDEEQRFGVEQKERLKEKYPAVDVLTLSATPIPRTLNMSLSGLRDMSSIDEAPSDRYPVTTYVTELDEGIITEAIMRELRRAGQVYYLHNRVDTITRCAAKLKERLPDAKIGIAHGRMSEEELSTVWQKLIEREIDVLVCTTIIETGVDVPNVNTLIIENAEKMGLSQLHQLRGRVGRSARRAYAYFCFPKGRELSDIAAKRLEAIRQFTEFGSGFKIAMRDLEIRGAGSVLSAEQHGHIESVGYDMYLKMLSDAVNELNGTQEKEEAIVCTVDLNVSAHIPERYIPSLTARLDIYKRIAAIENDADKTDVIDELCDRFGDPPKAVMGLIDISLLRSAAANSGIAEITETASAVILHTEKVREETAAKLSLKFKDKFVVSVRNSVPCYVIRKKPGEKTQNIVSSLAEILTK